VHVHGGGWRRGSRREPLPGLGPGFYESLAEEGFAVAAADYRLSGEARFPASARRRQTGGRCTLTTAERPPTTTARASLSTRGSSSGSATVTP